MELSERVQAARQLGLDDLVIALTSGVVPVWMRMAPQPLAPSVSNGEAVQGDPDAAAFGSPCAVQHC